MKHIEDLEDLILDLAVWFAFGTRTKVRGPATMAEAIPCCGSCRSVMARIWGVLVLCVSKEESFVKRIMFSPSLQVGLGAC